MPSQRRGLACAECPLWGYNLPHSNDESQQVISGVAAAVAYYAECEFGEQSTDEELNEVAEACAQKIVENNCTLWVVSGKNAGFVFRDGRHRPIGT